MAAARQEADRILDEARADAEQSRSRLTEELAKATEALADRIAVENRCGVDAVAERAASEAAVLDSVGDDSRRRLAEHLFERLLEMTTGPVA